MEEIGYFEISAGNKSSSRLTAFITVMASLALATLIIVVGCWIAIDKGEVAPLLAAAGSAGAQFGVIAGGAMFYMYNQKKQETK